MTTQIIKLSPDEWRAYRDLRLLALKTDPLAFGSSYDEEVSLLESDWRNRIDSMWFAIEEEQPVGMIGLIREKNRASLHCGYVVSLWVRPSFQGKGIATALVQKLLDISPTLGLRKLSLEVTLTQQSALKLYEKMGFRKVGLLRDNLCKNGDYLDEYLMECLIDTAH